MPKTLLLADDSVTIQKVVGISFANEDIVLLTVDNGDAAITKAQEAHPDLVLADVVMPGKNGYEVCEAIKGDSNLKDVPVLLLTGTFEAFDQERASRAGADGHITKPFEAQALVDQVNALLARAASATPAPKSAPKPADEEEAQPSPAAGASYDFFDDEATAPRANSLTPAAQPGAGSPATPDADLDLGETGGQSFRFDASPDLGDELEVPAEPDPAPGGGGDETVILPAGSDLLAGGGDEAAPSFVEGEAGDAEPTAEPVFDALDDVATVPGTPASATLDPAGARDYDVSSTDLGDPLSAGPGMATPMPEPEPEPEPILEEEPEALTDPPLAEPVRAVEPPPIPETPAVEAIAPPPLPEPAVEPPPIPEPPTVAAEPPILAAEPPTVVTEPPPVPESVEDVPVAATLETPSGAPEITPAMREEIRTALEKVAWEAFGGITEGLVKETLERIEKIAWEVVPQLAETLVQEEIRRMKGD